MKNLCKNQQESDKILKQLKEEKVFLMLMRKIKIIVPLKNKLNISEIIFQKNMLSDLFKDLPEL